MLNASQKRTKRAPLRLGFDRFWLLLRCVLLEGLLLFGIILGGVYIASILFMFTPWSRQVTELLAPVLENVTLLSQEMVLDEALYAQLTQAMIPAFVMCAIVAAALAIPVLFRLRMAHFIIIDKPGIGAMAALRESRKMMKGNCLKLFKLDVRLWLYYAGSLAASILCYGDVLLGMAGVTFPWSGTVSYYLFFALYLAAQFAVYYFLRNPAETAYAIAYDSIRPREPKSDGAPISSPADAAGLGGNQTLVVELQQQIGFQQLGLNGRSTDRKDRFPGENGRPLRHGPDVAGKFEIAQIFEKSFVKDASAAEIGNVLLVKVKLLNIVYDLLQPGRNGKAAAVRYFPEEYVKIGHAILHTAHKVAIAHRKLVKIAQHGQIDAVCAFHALPPVTVI